MRFTFTVELEVNRIQGKFASRDEITEAITSALDDLETNIDISGLGPDGESEYEIIDFSHEEIPQPKRRKA